MIVADIELWRRLSEAIAEEITRRNEGITSGNLGSYDTYRFECGVVQGLRLVLDKAEDIVKQAHQGAPQEQQEEDTF